MNKIIICSLLLFVALGGKAQQNLFSEQTDVGLRQTTVNRLSEKAQKRYNAQLNNRLVSSITLVKIDVDALKEKSLIINHGIQKVLAKQTEYEKRADNDYSWFGKLEDETGIFFTVMNKQIASKFYIGTVPYTLLPLEGVVHMLIEYNPQTNLGSCPTRSKPQKAIPVNAINTASPEITTLATPLPNDNSCNIRILIAVTAAAESELGASLAQTAQMLQDEANLAYQQSLVNFRMEIARVTRTSYIEANDDDIDVDAFQAGTSPLNATHSLREVYKADVMVLLRKGSLFPSSGGWLFGQAYQQPVTSDPPNAAKAFCMVTTDFLIGGRFTFVHEIGHLQGARHDDDVNSPSYARGFIQGNIIGPLRTIMATANVTSCSFTSSGCRIQYFSNPDINVGGPVGAADRNNARRLNETASSIRNHRATSENLVVQNETFDDEILANHLGNSTVSTSGTVTASSGSWVTFRATDEITLNPGFSANLGSDFTGVLINNPCTSLPPHITNEAPRSSEITTFGLGGIKDNTADAIGAKEFVRSYPNPSDNIFNIEFSMLRPAKVSLVVTDISGRIIKEISKTAFYESGLHLMKFNTGNVPKGVYVYSLFIGSVKHTSKFVIAR